MKLRIYERNGQYADARWLHRKAAWGVTKASPFGLTKVARIVYGLLTGHGYAPLRAGLWLIGVVAAIIIIVFSARSLFTPTASNPITWATTATAENSERSITGVSPCEQLSHPASCLNPWLYAFDSVSPGTLTTGQANLWTPNKTLWLAAPLGLLKTFSWILVALLLAGVTGLLRKT